MSAAMGQESGILVLCRGAVGRVVSCLHDAHSPAACLLNTHCAWCSLFLSVTQPMSEDYPASDDDDGGSDGGFDGLVDDAEEKELMVECGQRQVSAVVLSTPQQWMIGPCGVTVIVSELQQDLCQSDRLACSNPQSICLVSGPGGMLAASCCCKLGTARILGVQILLMGS